MNLLVGLVLPPIIDYLNKHVANEIEKFIVACLTCLLVAIIVDFNQIAKGDATMLVQTAGVIFLEASIIFNLYWKNSFLRDKFQEKISSTS